MATTSLQHKVWLVALLCTAVAGLPAADAPRGRPIEFSEPHSENTNNVQSLMPGRTTMLDQLEADVNRPFKSIIPGNSLNPLIMPEPGSMPQSPVSSARVREIINRRNDRKYLSPEELYAPKTLEELYKPRELTAYGRDVKSLSGGERQVMKALEGDRSAQATNQIRSILGPGYGDAQNGAFSSPNGNPAAYVNPQENMLRKTLGIDASSSVTANVGGQRDSRELFGLGGSPKSPPKMTSAELQRRDSLMQIYNPNYVAPVDGAAPVPGGFSTPYVDSSFYDPPKPAAPAASAVLSGSSSSAASAPKPYTPAYLPPPPPVQPTPRPEPISPFGNGPRRIF